MGRQTRRGIVQCFVFTVSVFLFIGLREEFDKKVMELFLIMIDMIRDKSRKDSEFLCS